MVSVEQWEQKLIRGELKVSKRLGNRQWLYTITQTLKNLLFLIELLLWAEDIAVIISDEAPPPLIECTLGLWGQKINRWLQTVIFTIMITELLCGDSDWSGNLR
jgi:hypothetical protein